MRKRILFIYSLLFSVFIYGQERNKFMHELSEYNLKIEIDSHHLFRIQYAEMKDAYRKAGRDFDKLLAGINCDAIFLYSLKKSAISDFTDESSIRIEITKDNGVDKPFLLNAKDTLNSSGYSGFLDQIHTNSIPHADSVNSNKVFFDLATNSYLEKYLTITQQMAGYKMKNQNTNRSLVEPHYQIFQIFYRDGYFYKIEYNCFKSESKLYFKTFESMISSLI